MIFVHHLRQLLRIALFAYALSILEQSVPRLLFSVLVALRCLLAGPVVHHLLYFGFFFLVGFDLHAVLMRVGAVDGYGGRRSRCHRVPLLKLDLG